MLRVYSVIAKKIMATVLKKRYVEKKLSGLTKIALHTVSYYGKKAK